MSLGNVFQWFLIMDIKYKKKKKKKKKKNKKKINIGRYHIINKNEWMNELLTLILFKFLGYKKKYTYLLYKTR